MNKLFRSINVNNQYIKYRLPSLRSEIYLIKWFPKSETEYHDHRGKQCNFVLIKGNQLNEIRKKNDTIIGIHRTIYPFKIYSINDTIGIHKMINTSKKIKWSIHRYY